VVFHDPAAPLRVAHELQRALGERGFGRFADAVGYAHRPLPPVAEPVAPDHQEAPVEEEA
jgi:hypothetical protein